MYSNKHNGGKIMGKLLAVLQYTHKQGYLYYCKRSKEGLIEIYEVEMARGGRKKQSLK